jgi:hypothetical protein
MPEIISYNGIAMANIVSINGKTPPSGGGTTSTTPTLSVAGGTFGSVTVTVTNHSSYTNPNYECSAAVGGTTTVSDANVDHLLESDASGLSDTLLLSDTNSTTGTRTVTVKAQEFGDNIQSSAATTTYDVNFIQNAYVRIQGVTSTGQATTSRLAMEDLRLFTGQGQTGTEYPTTALTSDTSETGIKITYGHSYSSTYDGWKAVDSSTASMWWTLGNSVAANNWWQIEFQKATYSSAPTIKSIQVRFDSQTDASYFKILGSNTGAFSGEETDYGVFQIIEDTIQNFG